MINKILDILIGASLTMLVVLSVQLGFLYAQPDESLAQETEKSSHPWIDGQPIQEMSDADCLACHKWLP